MRLALYNRAGYTPGASFVKQILWWFFGAPICRCSLLPSSRVRSFLLRLFGAKIGADVVIKPGVRVKYPWNLSVGDHSWIGEGVWLDNLAPIAIGANSCISQDAYLCTGSHNWSEASFDLIVKPIEIGEQVWIAARSAVGPGVHVAEGVVLTLGSVAVTDLAPWGIYQGNPAQRLKDRRENPAG